MPDSDLPLSDLLPLGPRAPRFQLTHLPGESVLRNVVEPALLPVRPPPGRENGRAVLVVPGGGYLFVAIGNEGLPVARGLAEAGYTAFVLVYRTLPTAPDDAAFADELPGSWDRLAEQLHRDGDLAAHAPAVYDACRAMRWLREHATQQGWDPASPGFLGFSAGARSGRALVQVASPREMPATLALIYGGFAATSPRTPVPPLFLAQAADDPLFDSRRLALLQDWARAGQRAELHLYERGGHGFGLQARGTTSDGWFAAYLAWLDRQA